MLMVKYTCGLRTQPFEAELPSGKNKLKDFKTAISKEIRVKPHLLCITQTDRILEDDNEVIHSTEFYQVNVISELKQFNFLINSEGGKFFGCTLEENDLVQDLIDQVDQFLAQAIKEQFDSYNLIQTLGDQQTNLIDYQTNRQAVIGDLFKDTNVQLKIKLVHEVLTLKLIENDDNTRDIQINRNQTLLDLKDLIRPNLINFKIIINGKFPPQSFDQRKIKDVLSQDDNIFLIQEQDS